ncbi:MAG: acyltransferase, partial [Pseudomonadota bacterium]
MNNPTSLLPAVPPQMPQVKPNAFLRWLARCTLRMGGWKVTGTLPDIP